MNKEILLNIDITFNYLITCTYKTLQIEGINQEINYQSILDFISLIIEPHYLWNNLHR